MAATSMMLQKARDILLDRMFTETQIKRIIPRLHPTMINEPKHLEEIIDLWNKIMSRHLPDEKTDGQLIPSTSKPPKNSLIHKQGIDMNTILGDVEPDLLLFDPKKLITRHERLQGLGLLKNLSENWIILFNAPRGFYLQRWDDLVKKVYYIEHHVLDLLYDKKELKEMLTHPIVKSAAVVESDFDHIRTRYLFAHRTGWKSLAHLHKVQTAFDRVGLKELILEGNEVFLHRFAPSCSIEEYKCFTDLIKNNTMNEDDADVISQLADLNSTRH